MRIPSGSARLVSGFVVTAGQNNSFVLDWDLRRGLTDPIGQEGWHLTPALRIIDTTEFGSLFGQVADPLLEHESCPLAADDPDGESNVVYVFAGLDAVPDDLDGTDDPVTSARVAMNGDMAGAYTYTVEFLDPGDYTVAFTCQGLDDDPTMDDAIVFLGQVNATVESGEGTENQAPMIE